MGSNGRRAAPPAEGRGFIRKLLDLLNPSDIWSSVLAIFHTVPPWARAIGFFLILLTAIAQTFGGSNPRISGKFIFNDWTEAEKSGTKIDVEYGGVPFGVTYQGAFSIIDENETSFDRKLRDWRLKARDWAAFFDEKWAAQIEPSILLGIYFDNKRLFCETVTLVDPNRLRDIIMESRATLTGRPCPQLEQNLRRRAPADRTSSVHFVGAAAADEAVPVAGDMVRLVVTSAVRIYANSVSDMSIAGTTGGPTYLAHSVQKPNIPLSELNTSERGQAIDGGSAEFLVPAAFAAQSVLKVCLVTYDWRLFPLRFEPNPECKQMIGPLPLGREAIVEFGAGRILGLRPLWPSSIFVYGTTDGKGADRITTALKGAGFQAVPVPSRFNETQQINGIVAGANVRPATIKRVLRALDEQNVTLRAIATEQPIESGRASEIRIGGFAEFANCSPIPRERIRAILDAATEEEVSKLLPACAK